MSPITPLGNKISLTTIKEYIFKNQISSGDSLILNPQDFELIIQEIKATGGGISTIPAIVQGVLIIQDAADRVSIGQVQVLNK